MEDYERPTRTASEELAPASAPDSLRSDPALRGCQTSEYEGDFYPTIGRLVLTSCLGRGGFGSVFLAINPRLGPAGGSWAVKVLPPPTGPEGPALVARFLREARVAATLRSEHLVGVFDVDVDPSSGLYFLVMEWVPGMSAGACLRDSVCRQARGLGELAALDICIAATRGLIVAHAAGVTHRDVKPDNILIPCDDAGRLLCERAKLSDLGLARVESNADGITETASALGTLGYMAPEQIRDAKRAIGASDMFAMGATLYALLCGRSPFGAPTPMATMTNTLTGRFPPVHETRPDVSEATAAVIARCLAPRPDARHPDALALLEALLTSRAAAVRARSRAPEAADTGERREIVPPARRDGAPHVVTPHPREGLRPAARPLLRRLARNGAVQAAALAVTIAVLCLALWRGPVRAPAGDGARSNGGSGPSALDVVSEPAGARLIVDGIYRGVTPMRISDLTAGAHEIELSLEHHAPFRTTSAAVAPGRTATVHASLRRALGRVAIDGGTPNAEVTLRRTGVPTKEYRFRLDQAGNAAAIDCEAGDYEVDVAFDGFTRRAAMTSVVAGSSAVVRPDADPTHGFLNVRGAVAGGSVLIDGVVAGPAPLRGFRVPAGRRSVTVRADGCEDAACTVEVKAGELLDVPALDPMPWPVLVLTELGSGVSASVNGLPSSGRVSVAPGVARIVLTRPGAADQVQEHHVRAGGSTTVRPGPWTPVGGLDLSVLPRDALCSIAGERIVAGAALHPGTYVIRVERPGCVAQDLSVTVTPAATTRVDVRPWVLVETAMRLLADVVAWDSASSSERRAAADHAARVDPEVVFRELRRFRSGTVSHEVAIFVHTATGLEFALCPGGSFTAGSPVSEPGRAADEPMSEVSARPFLIARTELPARAWQLATNEAPTPGAALGLPVAGVSWVEADAWCRDHGLALPTEFEWEFACRAGTKTAYSFGDDGREMARYGVTRVAGGAESEAALGRMGERLPNAFGLHDMHGNLWEWCASESDPTVRVARGGSFRNRTQEARSASRIRLPAQTALDTVGLRPVRRLRME